MSSGDGSRLRGTPLEIRRRIRKGGARSTILKDWHLLRESSSRYSRHPHATIQFSVSRKSGWVGRGGVPLFPRSPSPLAVVLAGMISLPTFTYVYHKCASRAAFIVSRVPLSVVQVNILSRKEILIRFLILFFSFLFFYLHELSRSISCSRYSENFIWYILIFWVCDNYEYVRRKESRFSYFVIFPRVESKRRVNEGESLINLIDPRRSFYLDILESRMRPCGVVNTVCGTRITDRHLLPERTTSLAGLSGTREDFNRFFLCDASLLFFLFFGSKKKQQVEAERGKKKNEPVVYCRGAFKFDEPFLFLISFRD